MQNPKVIDADGHIYENQKSTPLLIDLRAPRL